MLIIIAESSSPCVWEKIFIKILTRRVDNYMRASDKWRMNQCGYKQDHRTEDNLFILKSIHESYAINKRKNIYAAFVDFSKFFDSIKSEIHVIQIT